MSIRLWYAIVVSTDEQEVQGRDAMQPTDEELEGWQEEGGEGLCEWAGEDCPFR